MRSILIAASVAGGLSLAAVAPQWAFAQPDGVQSQSQARGPVEIVVWNIRKSLGHIRVAVCTKATFVNARINCPYRADAPARTGVTSVVVPDVPSGTYAVQVFQDETDQNSLRQGPLGVPLEGIGFSNDAPVPLAKPRWEDARFDHDPATPLTLRIKLRYFPDL